MLHTTTSKHFNVLEGDQNIITGYIGGLLTLVGPLAVLWWHHTMAVTVSTAYCLIIWLVALGGCLGIVDYLTNKKTIQLNKQTQPNPFNKRFQQAFARWLAWHFIFILLLVLYKGFFLYSEEDYLSFWYLFKMAWIGWLFLGLPYYIISLKYFYGYRWDKYCPAFFILCITSRIFKSISNSLSGKAPDQYQRSFADLFWRANHFRIAWTSIIVRAFFVPLMLILFINISENAHQQFQQIVSAYTINDPTLDIYTTCTLWFSLFFILFFLIDTSLALLSYCHSSRMIDSPVKSVDKTGLGWISCIVCYPPWFKFVQWYFVFPTLGIGNLPDTPIKLILMGLVVLLVGIYAWSTIAFGLRFSNLSYRGMITRGPYRYCRHPAYAAKCLSWWVQFLPALTTYMSIVGMLGWTFIYCLRALTEERHMLSVNKKYALYMKQVRFRFVPGLV